MYVTDLLSRAAALVSRGHSCSLHAARTDKIEFHFVSTPELLADVEALDSTGRLSLAPVAYDAARRSLRMNLRAMVRAGGVQ